MKKFVALLCIVVLAFYLAGCGSPAANLLSLQDAENPENQVSLASAYMTGQLEALKKIKKVAIAEFTVGYLYHYEFSGYGTRTESRFKFGDEAYQYAADKLYNDFVEILEKNGIDVAEKDSVLGNENFQKLVGKEAEEIHGYHQVDQKVIKYRLIPASGFKVTGGGTGFDLAGNAMAQIPNKGLYPRISRDLDVDATITVHLMVGYNKQGKLTLSPNHAGNLELFKIYYGVTDDGHNNVFANQELIINLDSQFGLKDVGDIEGEVTIDALAETYSTLLKVLFNATAKKSTSM